METLDAGKDRFETELEFVQCLCNVRYLHRERAVRRVLPIQSVPRRSGAESLS